MAKRVTLNAVNRALAALGHKEKLVKGNGYFYFIEGDSAWWYSTSVYTFHLNDLTVEQWVAEHAEKRADALARFGPNPHAGKI
jgi:hypothetical protein